MPTMEVKKLIKLRNLTVTDAAKQIGISRQLLSDIIHGKAQAGGLAARKIMTWSDGAVQISDLWRDAVS